ncbi:MAG TPA: class II glutamine amidotransferase [Actinobacteria bacterium]|nr:class II glutamine amidotransferase [Actinomycetota bacterium]
MCRMLGLIDGAIDYNLLKDFQKLALVGKVKANMDPGHSDGWGAAGLSKNKATMFGKSKKSAAEDPDYDVALNKAALCKTPILIAHIRKATSGSTSLENTHPFIKDGWIFSHNGTIHNSDDIEVGRLTPAGTTDSERFFYHCLRYINSTDSKKELGQSIKKAISEIKSKHDYSSLTFLLANNKYLIAYRDYNADSENAADFERYYTLYIAAQKDFITLCSEPIGLLSFSPFKNGQLLIASKSDIFETVLS